MTVLVTDRPSERPTRPRDVGRLPLLPRLEVRMVERSTATHPEEELRWGVHPSPFGPVLIVAGPDGLDRLAFVGEGGIEEERAEVRAARPHARLVEDAAATAELARRAFAPRAEDPPLPLRLVGTAFELRVWRALLAIPTGETRSYGALAAAIGSPGAARAVGAACGRNPIAWLVPCHRVVAADGSLGGYRWGLALKERMLAQERARTGAARG